MVHEIGAPTINIDKALALLRLRLALFRLSSKGGKKHAIACRLMLIIDHNFRI